MRTLTTTGTGSILVAPDRASVRVSAQARGATPAEAFAVVASSVEAILTIARRHTEERRLASENLNLWPWHGPEGNREGFESRHSLVIGCADLASAQTLIDELVAEVGEALTLDGLSLEVTDPAHALVEARAAAFAAAREAASQWAALAEVSLGEVVSLSEGAGAGDYPVPVMRGLMAGKESIAPGETSVSASVTVTWELKAGG